MKFRQKQNYSHSHSYSHSALGYFKYCMTMCSAWARVRELDARRETERDRDSTLGFAEIVNGECKQPRVMQYSCKYFCSCVALLLC